MKGNSKTKGWGRQEAAKWEAGFGGEVWNPMLRVRILLPGHGSPCKFLWGRGRIRSVFEKNLLGGGQKTAPWRWPPT